MSEPEYLHNLEQGTPEWLEARRGLPTASRFKDLLTQGRSGAPSKTRLGYAYTLAADLLGATPAEAWSTAHTERGHEWEPEARSAYELITGNDVEQCGFVRRGRAGYSPDGLVGTQGLLEVKTHAPHILLPLLLAGGMPDEHRAQVQGGLWVSGRAWCDLVCYWPGLPLYIHREHRDEAYIGTLVKAVETFNAEVDAIVQRVRLYEESPVLLAA